MAGKNERTLSARALAEAALACLMESIGDHAKVTVIGGMVPQTLTSRSRTPHVGTADLDILLDVAPRYDRDDDDFGWLQVALESAGFTRIEQGGGWRWLVKIEDKAVVVEFMCDVPDSQGLTILLPGAPQVAALNFAGPAPSRLFQRLKCSGTILLRRGSWHIAQKYWNRCRIFGDGNARWLSE